MAPTTRSKGPLQPVDLNSIPIHNDNYKKKDDTKTPAKRVLWNEFEGEVGCHQDDDTIKEEEEGHQKEWKHEDFEFLEKVGEGSQASVWKVRHTPTEDIYAVKQIPYHRSASSTREEEPSTQQKYADRELSIHLQISKDDHPGIVAWKGHYFTTPNNDDDDKCLLCLVLEYCPLTLLDMLRENNGTPFPERKAALYFSQLVAALDHLHSVHHVIHRDIKLANILVTEDGSTIKVADFGIATHASSAADEDRRKTIVGTPGYQAPEIDENTDRTDAGRKYMEQAALTGHYAMPPVGIDLHDSQYNTQVDVYSLGVTLHAMVTGQLPCEGNDSSEESTCILGFCTSDVDLTIPDFVSTDCMDLLSGLLEEDAHQRMTLKQVMKHPWLDILNREG